MVGAGSFNDWGSMEVEGGVFPDVWDSADRFLSRYDADDKGDRDPWGSVPRLLAAAAAWSHTVSLSK
jgi:hypothetical protein